MAVEQTTAAQQAASAMALSKCKESKQQNLAQDSAEAMKKAKEEIDQATQKLASIPKDIMKNIQDAMSQLMSIINGYEDPYNPNYDPYPSVTYTEKLLDSIVSQLKSLPVPDVPGLSQIVNLLAVLSSTKKSTMPKLDMSKLSPSTLSALSSQQNLSNQSQISSNLSGNMLSNNISSQISVINISSQISSQLSSQLSSQMSSQMSSQISAQGQNQNNPAVPPELLECLQDLLVALQSLCTMLPMVLIKLVFDMLEVIIKLFKQIAGVIGVPSIPFPLSLVPQCIPLVTDIMEFICDTPGKTSRVIKAVLSKKSKEMMEAQIPSAPDGIKQPEVLAPCPQRSNSEALSSDLSSQLSSDVDLSSNISQNQGSNQSQNQSSNSSSSQSQSSSSSSNQSNNQSSDNQQSSDSFISSTISVYLSNELSIDIVNSDVYRATYERYQ